MQHAGAGNDGWKRDVGVQPTQRTLPHESSIHEQGWKNRWSEHLDGDAIVTRGELRRALPALPEQDVYTGPSFRRRVVSAKEDAPSAKLR